MRQQTKNSVVLWPGVLPSFKSIYKHHEQD